MKKTYITPALEVIKVCASSLMASSMGINNNEEDAVDTSNGGQLGREDNPSRPNLWEQGW